VGTARTDEEVVEMVKELQEGDSEFIAGAASYADKFLGVIQQRCNEAGIGVVLAPIRVGRKQENRVVMRGTVTMGSTWKGKKPYLLEVYADPAGQNLQVGFQLSTEEVGGFMANTNAGMHAYAKGVRINNDPDTQRRLKGILQGFYQMVFAPTVQDLTDVVAASRQRSNGFLGA
jgi:hypothetical protein